METSKLDEITLRSNPKKAKVYGVTTSIGGSGCSVLAYNIAKEKLRANPDLKVVLVDLQFKSELNYFLECFEERGLRWAEILKSSVSPQMMFESLPSNSNNIKILTSNIKNFYFPTVNEIVQTINYIGEEVDEIIIDIPWVFCFNPLINKTIDSFYILTPRSFHGINNTQYFVNEQKLSFFKESQIITIPHSSKYHLLEQIKTVSVKMVENILGQNVFCEMKLNVKTAFNFEFNRPPDASFISKAKVDKLFQNSKFLKNIIRKNSPQK